MRGSVPKRLSLLVALATLSTSALGLTGASANHGTDTPGYVEQAGNGSGDSATPVIKNFGLGTVLFSNERFPFEGHQRPTYPKYLAWGSVATKDAQGQAVNVLAMARGGDDGLRWDTPSQASLRDATGTNAPFLLNDQSGDAFDVVFTDLPDAPFLIYYRVAGGDINTIDEFHSAQSIDGVNWINDGAITQADAAPLVNATRASYGPTDVIYQPGKSFNNACSAGGTTPWNCPVVMLYDLVLGSSEELGIAASGDLVEFSARTDPILTVGATGSWDDDTASLGHIRQVDGTFQLFYAGGGGPGYTDSRCAGGRQGCWSLGVATSTDGLHFTKSPNNPATPSSLIDTFSTDASSGTPTPITIRNPQSVDDASGGGHAKIYFNRVGNAATKPEDVFLAYTAPPPGDGPSLRFASPGPARNTATTPIDLYINDTIGSPPGANLDTLSITVDGVPVTGGSSESTIIGAQKVPGLHWTVSGDDLRLAEGVHPLVASVEDFDGHKTTVSMTLTVDLSAPGSTLTTVPASPRMAYPGGLGTFEGTTTDAPAATSSGLGKLRVTVTNPAGERRAYDSTAATPKAGFTITAQTSKTWNWRWVAPVSPLPFNTLTPDLFYAYPGTYTVTIGGVDTVGNYEKASTANTATVTVV